jgi:hypothetical protein
MSKENLKRVSETQNSILGVIGKCKLLLRCTFVSTMAFTDIVCNRELLNSVLCHRRETTHQKA